jgi:hypothetical protein
MDGKACERAARIPIVLLDCHFSDVEWWNRVATEGVYSGASRSAPCFSSADAAPLLREILVEARTIAISEPRAASLMLGAPSALVSVIAALTSTRIDQISLTFTNELRPRWEDKAGFWTKLFNAAINGKDEVISEVIFHSIQLLGNELMTPSVAPGGRTMS